MSGTADETTPRPHVMVFDSGVGGLSVLRAVAEYLPGVALTYACDNAAFPYGDKSEDELVARVDAVLTALVGRFAPDLLVVACNTASTVALPSAAAARSICRARRARTHPLPLTHSPQGRGNQIESRSNPLPLWERAG
jgi:hypothetical protein